MSLLAHRRIAFLGGGNMAEALVRGLLTSQIIPAEAIRVSDPNTERRVHFEQRYGVVADADNESIAAWANLVVVAVKPQAMAQVLPSLRVVHELIVTIVAGVPARTLEAVTPGRVVRAMPNTPALVRAGATAIAAGSRSTAADMDAASALFSEVGLVVRVTETALDAVTGLSGSGPAYVMLAIEALVEGGVKMGLARPVALTLAAQTVYGSAKLQLETGEDPATLRERVTSPGGTTVAGLASLESGGFRAALIDAVAAATRRATELGR